MNILKFGLLSVLVPFLIACGGGGSGQKSGKLSLGVTDAPVDQADAVVVTFVAIELLDAQGAVSQTFDLDPPQSIDLLTLQGNNSALLVQNVDVPAGVYEDIRLTLDTENANCQNLTAPFASYISIDGTESPLVVPSGGQSGLKVRGPLTIATGGSASYVIDFDLRKSIAQRGNTGCFNLRPVLRVVDTSEIGSLTGLVDGDLLVDENCTADPLTGAGAAIYLFAGTNVTPDDVDGIAPEPLASALLTAQPDESGDFSYTIGFLPAGDYTAAFTCTAADDDPEIDDFGSDPEPGNVRFGAALALVISPDSVTRQDFLRAADQAP